MSKGYIPIIDVSSFENIFNSFTFSSSKKFNPWEVLFNQPFNYTLEEVKENAKKIDYFSCSWTNMAPSEGHIYSNVLNIKLMHDLAKKYMPVKKEIIDETNIIWKNLFGDTKNVLGVLARGTDFKTLSPSGHSIPPSTETIIGDVKNLDKKNKYDWIYLATEDDEIRGRFIKEFGEKLKMLQKENTGYKFGPVGSNPKLHGIEFQKLYLESMLIISKCIDVVITRCSGAMGAFVFSEGFRESLVYFLGQFN